MNNNNNNGRYSNMSINKENSTMTADLMATLRADWDIKTELAEDHTDMDFDEIHMLALSTMAQRQAEDFRALASAIEATGIPVAKPSMVEPMVHYSNDPSVIRRNAGVGKELLRALGLPVSKIASDTLWGVEGTMPSGIKVGYSAWNSATCEQVPVLDDNGEPVMHTVTKMVAVDVIEAKTEKKCMTILGPNDAHVDA